MDARRHRLRGRAVAPAALRDVRHKGVAVEPRVPGGVGAPRRWPAALPAEA